MITTLKVGYLLEQIQIRTTQDLCLSSARFSVLQLCVQRSSSLVSKSTCTTSLNISGHVNMQAIKSFLSSEKNVYLWDVFSGYRNVIWGLFLIVQHFKYFMLWHLSYYNKQSAVFLHLILNVYHVFFYP